MVTNCARPLRRIGLVALAASLAWWPVAARAADHVSVSMSYTPWAAYMPLYVGLAKGFYEKAGLAVDIKPNRGAAATMLVGTGEEQFTYLDPAAVLAARDKGVPLVVTAVLNQDNGAALFATEASGITKVADMKGRNVGAFTGSPTTIFLQALLNKAGMGMSDVNIVTVRSGTDLPLVLNGGIDAEVTIANNELISWPIEHPELKLRVWRLRDIGFDTPGYALATSEKLLAEAARRGASLHSRHAGRARLCRQAPRRGGRRPERQGAGTEAEHRSRTLGGYPADGEQPGHRRGRPRRHRSGQMADAEDAFDHLQGHRARYRPQRPAARRPANRAVTEGAMR